MGPANRGGGAGQLDRRRRLRHRLTPEQVDLGRRPSGLLRARTTCGSRRPAARSRHRPSPARRRSARATSAAARHRRRTVEQAGAGAARQHVVERDRHLCARRVHRLGLQVGQPGHERLAERRVGVDQRGDLARPACRSGRRGAAAWRCRRWSDSRRRRPAAGAWSRQRARTPRTSQTSSTVSSAISRYVVSLPPVTRDDAAGAAADLVAARQVGGAARRRRSSPAAAGRPTRR